MVPEETSEWNPLIVPQAIVMKSSGNSGASPAASAPQKPLNAPSESATTSGWEAVPSRVPTMTASSVPPTPVYSRNDER